MASLAMTGHAATAQPRGLATVALMVHGGAAAFWLGSLVALGSLLQRDAGSAQRALWRFSNRALACVALLASAGIGLALLQVDSLGALTQTPYGRLIVLKAMLLAAALALAASNRWIFLPRLADQAQRNVPRLRRAISGEIAILIIVVSVTAVLAHTPPRVAPISKILQANGMRAVLTIAPGRVGRNAMTVELDDGRGQTVDAADVEIDVSNRDAGIEPMRRRMQRTAPGQYRYEGSELAFAGAWAIEVRARMDDFDLRQWSTQVDLGSSP
jgi:copper transport protein